MPGRSDAEAIWRAGVAAVGAERLLREQVRVDGEWLCVADQRWKRSDIRRLVVVGAGKAGAGMAAGLEEALGEQIARELQLAGWVNVPADCLRPLSYVTLHPARPAGLNEPTEAGVAGAERILEWVSQLAPSDLCLCLISGGGSALLPAPLSGITLADKQQVTRQLSAAGANIRELNTVRKQLSRVKGGGLARACRAGSLVTLIISDVLGDPLDIIASGPTVPDPADAAAALDVLETFLGSAAPPAVLRVLRERAAVAEQHGAAAVPGRDSLSLGASLTDYVTSSGCRVINRVIGNNAVAVQAAAAEARRRGYAVTWEAATQLEGEAEQVGCQTWARFRELCGRECSPVCLVTGGEPVVKLAPADRRGKGGRNQQLVLAALVQMLSSAPVSSAGSTGSASSTGSTGPIDSTGDAGGQAVGRRGDVAGVPSDWAFLSGGTDGEDGPTDAAGAVADSGTCAEIRRQQLDPVDYLARNDAYRLFQQTGGLILTGPTHTNVCDLRVLVGGTCGADVRSGRSSW